MDAQPPRVSSDHGPTDALNRVTSRALVFALSSLSAVYVVSAVTHPLRFNLPASAQLASLSAFTAALFFSGLILIRRVSLGCRAKQWVALGIASLVLINVQAILTLSSDMRYSVNILLTLMGVGFILFPLHHLIGFHALTIGSWAAIVAFRSSFDQVAHFILPAGIAMVVAYTCRTFVVRNEAELERARLRDEEKRRELQEAFASLEVESRARREASRETERAHKILSTVSNLVLIADADGGITYVSPSVERTLGFRQEEILGEGWFPVSRADHESALRDRQFVAKAARERSVQVAYERQLRDCNGGTHWILWQDTPFEEDSLIRVGSDITELRRIQEERDGLIEKLQATIAKARTLEGLLPICMHCKKIREDSGYWTDVELFVSEHSHAEFSHGLCPDCEDAHYSEREEEDALT